MLKKIYFMGSLLFLIACQSEKERFTITESSISNKTFSGPILVDGDINKLRGKEVYFSNCTFENIDGDAVQVDNIDCHFDNCTFRNITGNAVHFMNSGGSSNSEISNSQFYNIKKSGIYAAGGHRNLYIWQNEFHDIASDNNTATGEIYHAIHVRGAQTKVQKNTIYNIGKSKKGNGIEINSNGYVMENEIYGVAGHAVQYAATYLGERDTLWIENNMFYDNGKAAIALSNGDNSSPVKAVVARFNTLVSMDQPLLSIDDQLTRTNINWLCNIVIRTDGNPTVVASNLPYKEEKNLVGNGDVGFVDFLNRKLHLGANSTAENFATGTLTFPLFDMDGDARQASNLDAGADER